MFYQQQQQRQQATKAAIQQPLSSRGGGIGGSANPWVAMRDMGTWTQQQKLQQAQYYAATSSSPSATSTMMMMSKAGGNGGGGSIMPTTAGPSTMMLTGRGNTTPTPGSSFTSFGAASASLGATTRHSMTTPPAGQQRSSSFASSPAVSDRHYSAGGMMAHRPSTTTAIAGFGFPPGRADCDKDRVMGTGGPAAEPTKKTVASGAAPPANSGKDGKEPYLWWVHSYYTSENVVLRFHDQKNSSLTFCSPFLHFFHTTNIETGRHALEAVGQLQQEAPQGVERHTAGLTSLAIYGAIIGECGTRVTRRASTRGGTTLAAILCAP